MRSWEAGQDLLRAWESRGPNTALISVEDAVSRFLEDLAARHLTAATVGKQKVLLSRLVAFAEEIGVKFISQLTSESMVRFRASWTDSPISALKKLERLRSFFRFCAGMKWVDENPVGMLKAPKFHQKPTLPFTGEEFERILAAVDKYPTKNSFGIDNRARLRAFVLLLRYSGLRIRDAVCLRRDRIVDGKLMVYTQKTGQPVYVPLPPVVIESFGKSGKWRAALLVGPRKPEVRGR